MITIKELQDIMNEKNINQSELSRRLNCTRGTVNKWFQGKGFPTHKRWLQIYKVLDIEFKEKVTKNNNIKKIPILSYVQAGDFTDHNYKHDYDFIDYLPLDCTDIPINSFLMRVVGNSMIYDTNSAQQLSIKYSKYNINEDELILVDPNQKDINLLKNKIVLANNGEGVTVKLLYEQEKGFCLMPLNSRMQNNIKIKSPDEAIIIGRVTKIIKFTDI